MNNDLLKKRMELIDKIMLRWKMKKLVLKQQLQNQEDKK